MDTLERSLFAMPEIVQSREDRIKRIKRENINLVIKWNNNARRGSCPLCGKEIERLLGFTAFVEGIEGVVCSFCTEIQDQPLAYALCLLEMAECYEGLCMDRVEQARKKGNGSYST